MSTEITYQLKDIPGISKELLKAFTAKIVLFKGEMGSGKTTLVKGLINEMSSVDVAHSPSFSLVNEYETSYGRVFHFDLYRIEDPEEVWDIGFEDYLTRDAWLFIEWPELVVEALPSEYQSIDINIISDTSRSLKLTIKNKVLTENRLMTDI